MRILVFTDEYDYGYFTFIYNEIKFLKESGIDVYVVCERIGKLKEVDLDYSRIPMTGNSFFRNAYLAFNRRGLFFFIAFYRYFKKRMKIIRDFKPDLVHVHFGDTATRLYFPMKKLLKKMPYVVSFHGFDASSHLNNSDYLKKLNVLIPQPNFYGICVSEHLRMNLLAKGLNLNEKNSSILYYGINIDVFQRTSRQDNEVKIFLQISGFYEKKGHIYTLMSFKKFLERNKGKAKLVIGGDGPLKEEILNACKELGLCNEVEFPGWISRVQAVNLLNEADYFVHHSVTAANGDQEGMPNAIIEAMAMELPIISTIHSGIPELVEDGVNGYLVKERDIDTYALRMEQVLSWPHLVANREKVQRRFSLKAHTKSLISIYNKLIPGKTG